METPPDRILVSSDNLSQYGFACFHQKGEAKVKDKFWLREVETVVGGEHGSIMQELKIPEEFLIEVSQEQRIVNSNNYEICTHPSSVDIIKSLSARAGWNQTDEDLMTMCENGKDGIFIASYMESNQNIPLGSGVSLAVNNDLCWIGMILVHPELRRQGIARSIMNKCLEHALLKQNKKIVGLDATPIGKQVYDSLGFKDSFTIWRSVVSTLPGNVQYKTKSIESFNLDSVKNYLIERNYPERTQIIDLLSNLPGSKNIMATSKDQVLGFVMSRPGRLKPFIGPLIANTPEVALSLLIEVLSLWKTSGYERVFMDIPEQHLTGSIYLNVKETSNIQQIPVNPVRSLIRMYQLVTKQELEKSASLQTDPSMQKAFDHRDESTTFMKKEKNKIVPIMYATSGPEWS